MDTTTPDTRAGRSGGTAARLPTTDALDKALELAEASSAYEWQTRRHLKLNFARLGRYLVNARGVEDLRAASTDDIVAWVTAANPDASPPALRTMHNRRSAARAAFRLLREAGLVDTDPTGLVDLPSRDGIQRATRPLTDAEVSAGRAAAVANLRAVKRPAAWALAEASATTHEIATCRASDIDLADGSVWLRGSRSTQAREALLTEWGGTTLRRLVAGAETDERIAYSGDGDDHVAQVSVSRSLAAVMQRAGFYQREGVTAASLRAWTGVKVLEQTERVEQVALTLGCQSLDVAADIVGYAWQDEL